MFKLNNKIKLVIWDLDETFWKGTFSEEGIIYNQNHHNLIIELTDRGIVNSICSKNNYENIKKILVEKEIWDYFVFSAIDWQPKGLMVKQIIERMGLRAINVLFIDDNLLNLNEVSHMNKDINVCEPEYIVNLLKSKYLQGKNDKNHTRLEQYKNLEKKVEDFELSAGSNIEFLKESNIVVCLKTNCIDELDRLHELVERTNQLNFTKKRVSKEYLEKQFNNPDIDSGYISVQDKYGDYGITGFYMIIDNKLEHFLFSCRTLNMYIESWLYQKIGKPKLTIIGEVTSSLNEDVDVSFIKELCDINYKSIDTNNRPKSNLDSKILFIGGCDLDQVIFYLNSSSIETEFNYVNNMNVSVHKDHTILLKQFSEFDDKFINVIKNIAVLDSNDINIKLNTVNWDVLIFSPLNDYSRGLYKHKKTGFILPFDAFNIDWTDENNWNNMPKHLISLPKDFLVYLKEEFIFLGAITPQEFQSNLLWLIDRFSKRHFIFLNGSEYEIDNVAKWEKNMSTRHKEMNKILYKLSNDKNNVELIDINNIITSQEQHTDNIRHYHKSIYKDIAEKIIELLNVSTDYEIKKNSNLNISIKHFSKRVKSKLKKLFK